MHKDDFSMAAVPDNPLAERRAFPRIPVEITSMLRTEDGKHCAIVMDLSLGGMAIRSAESLLSNSRIDVWFALPYSDQTIECEGKVVWTDGVSRAGVQFTVFPEDARSTLADWLAKYATIPNPQ